ncbi:MAG: hypothetical protein RMK50_03130 [Nitrososphaerota archaeon]|nr:hypothetical protein [Candidatus Bathyarchaeota archaeon]MDW8193802.1 hypothetical protein [Nitrososphaerota archaeon]
MEHIVGYVKERWYRYEAYTCPKNFNKYAAFLSGKEQTTFILFSNLHELHLILQIGFSVLLRAANI